MDLIKKNIHMDYIKAEASAQFTLEDDINIPESKPDISLVNMEKGEILIEEAKPGTDVVIVRGRLLFYVLYHSKEEGSRLVRMEGKVPFEEKLHLKGVTATDNVIMQANVEDIRISMINSRKLNLQSVLSISACVEDLYDEEIPIGIHGDERVEYHKLSMNLAQLAVRKNDIFRIKEEIQLPSNYPNMYDILWDYVTLNDVEFKIQEGRIAIQGDLRVFVLYEGEGEERPVRSYETTIPFGGALDCHECEEGMFPDIQYEIGQKEISIRPDLDGEERNIGIELTIDLRIRVYEEEQTEVLSDLYGVTNEITAETKSARLRRLLSRVTGKSKLVDRIRVGSKGAGILQVLHSEAQVLPDSQEVVENGILLQGNLLVKVIYIAGDDERPYVGAQSIVPYQYTLEIPEIADGDLEKVHIQAEQLQVTMLDGEEMDVKVVLSFSTTVFRTIEAQLIEKISVEKLDTAKLCELPGIVIYTVKEGDNLWNIGKKYYISVASIRELNDLTNDTLRIGQKLLLAKTTQ